MMPHREMGGIGRYPVWHQRARSKHCTVIYGYECYPTVTSEPASSVGRTTR